MRANLVVLLVALATLAFSAAASAAPAGEVDRDRLKRTLANLPSIKVRWGIGIGPTGPTEWSQSSESPPDPAKLRAQLKGDDSDGDLHLDLAAVHRRLGDAAAEMESLRLATGMLEREAAAHPEDGHVLASLATALAASGSDARADEVLARGKALAHPGADVWAAAGNLLAARAIGTAAGRRFADVVAAYEWVRSGAGWTGAPPRLPAKTSALLDEAASAYGKAIEAATNDGPAAAVSAAYLDRWAFRTHRILVPTGAGQGATAAAEWADAVGDMVKAAEATPDDPTAITLVVALSLIPGESTGATVRVAPGRPPGEPRRIADLAAPVRARVEDGLARLATLSESKDAAVAARALQGLGAIRWLLRESSASVESSLRAAVAKDASLRQSWTLLMGMFIQESRWDDLAKLLREWIGRGDAADKRMFLAKAEERRGDGEESEKEWRRALALDPKAYETNLGLANAILRNAKEGADLGEATDLLTAAADAYRAATPQDAERWCELTLAQAVVLGLGGDRDGAAAAARRLLEYSPGDPLATEALAALGR